MKTLLRIFFILYFLLTLSISFASVDIPTSDLYGFQTVFSQPVSLNIADKVLMRRIAQNTWYYFRDAVDKETNLPVDQLRIAPQSNAGGFTSPTNIGLYLSSIISAYDFKFIDKKEAIERITRCLDAVDQLETYHGFLYNWYDFRPTVHRQNDFISYVDSGWYAMCLITIRQAFPKELGQRVTLLLNQMEFSFFYDPNTGQMWHGYYTESKKYSDYHYGVLCTEARGPSLMAIGKKNAPKEHWFRIYRTMPEETSWQKQKPKGRWKTYKGTTYFEGYYLYNKTKIVPSWGGSMFEFLMPLLFIDEQKFAPHNLGENNKRAVAIHIKTAKKLGYPVWGMSPCGVPGGDYGEYGATEIGMKESGYPAGIVTPHASFLALMVSPKESIQNIRNLIQQYKIYHPVYGFYDAVNPTTGEIAQKFLCLDQAMILLSLDNYLNQGIMQKRFTSDPIGKHSLPLLKIERFYN